MLKCFQLKGMNQTDITLQPTVIKWVKFCVESVQFSLHYRWVCISSDLWLFPALFWIWHKVDIKNNFIHEEMIINHKKVVSRFDMIGVGYLLMIEFRNVSRVKFVVEQHILLKL